MKFKLFILFSLTAISVADIAVPGSRYIRDEYLILLYPNTTFDDHNELFDALDGIRKCSIGETFKAIHATLSNKQLRWVSSHKNVDVVEHNLIVTTASLDNLKCSHHQSSPISWGQKRITSSSPRDTLADYTHNKDWGTNVDAYIIDTGVRCSHQEFGNRCIWGFNSIGGDDTDHNGHGTHCAGTVAGGMYGIAKNTTVIAVKVLADNGVGSIASVIAGIEWTVSSSKSRSKPSLANLSLGVKSRSWILSKAVDEAVKEGISFSIAAGNQQVDACLYSPALSESGVTVGSTDLNSDNKKFPFDMRSPSSNFGNCVDIFAPGTGTVSAYASSNTAYATLSGTSMAAAHVAGAMAVLLTAGPATPADIKNALITSSRSGILHLEGSPDRLLHLRC